MFRLFPIPFQSHRLLVNVKLHTQQLVHRTEWRILVTDFQWPTHLWFSVIGNSALNTSFISTSSWGLGRGGLHDNVENLDYELESSSCIDIEEAEKRYMYMLIMLLLKCTCILLSTCAQLTLTNWLYIALILHLCQTYTCHAFPVFMVSHDMFKLHVYFHFFLFQQSYKGLTEVLIYNM